MGFISCNTHHTPKMQIIAKFLKNGKLKLTKINSLPEDYTIAKKQQTQERKVVNLTAEFVLVSPLK